METTKIHSVVGRTLERIEKKVGHVSIRLLRDIEKFNS